MWSLTIIWSLAVGSCGAQTFPVQAGTGINGYSGDGGPAAVAQLAVPSAVFVDIDGNITIADTSNDRVRFIGSDGTIRTIAGNGDRASTGDGGPATDASLSSPTALFVDGLGNTYVAEWTGHRIRKISSEGTITTVVGLGTHGFQGDGKQGTESSIWSPSAIFIDKQRNLYIAEWHNNRIRKVSADGIVSTIAGTGIAGLTNDGATAKGSRINSPNGIFVSDDGVVYFSELGNQRVRRITKDGILETAAGKGDPSYSGDGGPATRAALDNPAGLFLDSGGNLFIADAGNGRIRRVTPEGIIDTVIGGALFGPDDATDPTELPLHGPTSIFIDHRGDLYVAEGSGHQVRLFPGLALPTDLPAAQPKTSDFDADTLVGFQDFLLFIEQFGKTTEDPTFDPRFDLLENGVIDFVDFLRFARAFGTTSDG